MASVHTLRVWEGGARVGWGSDMTPQESLKNHKSYQLETFQVFRLTQYEIFEQKQKKGQLGMLFFVCLTSHFLTNVGFSWPFLALVFMRFGVTFDRKTLYNPENQPKNVSKYKNKIIIQSIIQGCSSYRKKNYEQKNEGWSYLTRVNRVIIKK